VQSGRDPVRSGLGFAGLGWSNGVPLLRNNLASMNNQERLRGELAPLERLLLLEDPMRLNLAGHPILIDFISY
jgi:hypothetical protein